MPDNLWIFLDLCLFVVFCVTLYKQKDRLKGFLDKKSKEQTDILVKQWLMPLGIAFALYGLLWLGFHDSVIVGNIKHYLNPGLDIIGVNQTIDIKFK